MSKIISLGRWLFLLSLTLYVFLHFALADFGVKEFVPSYLPFPYVWNYVTGLCILAFIISGLVGRFDKLAALLFALYLVLVILLVHVPDASTNQQDFQNIFRGLNMLGATLMYAGAFARDNWLPFVVSAKPAVHQ
ncbi:hypothetical protein BN8_03017 [Fibrisoma limi BUZ 3]|uniref:DoxX family protein n=1 Tax=Fibrisoma limi BUZ 3 TaxID=1185876 RepID=I2GJ10_9BACT|nr:hypothetical protein [Fibrisoma limi]CCH53885.1 hypothetical protein BN8_03017 [Fibrisoma limi BUZ 3]